MHLPELGKTVSAAISTPAGTFAYSPDANIERLDVEALNSTVANAHLDIAMYAFTDHILANAVADAAERGVKVRIYRDEQQYEQESGRDQYVARKLAAEQNVSIRVKHSGNVVLLCRLLHRRLARPFNGMRTLSANIATEIPEAPVPDVDVPGTLYRILFLCACCCLS